ncbi:MAG TPA: HD-GYP domain-containing protein [Vicinamibacterales bacterium]|nr:HD-GYP domain-containing protein [Vicinamibacterales bacterium]
MKPPTFGRLEEVNKELWVVLSLFAIGLLLNYTVSSQRMILGFYALPTVISAYVYGRRHATLTALASVLLVVLLGMFSSASLSLVYEDPLQRWVELTAWGGTLIVTAYLMGTLYEHKSAQVRELRDTYHGVLMILRHFISKDAYTENHCHRVSVYAVRIAGAMNLDTERIEDVRAAALLHDIGKLDISRELLYKAARLTSDEYQQIQQHVSKGVQLLETVGGSLRRVIPIILAHHDRFDGSGYHPTRGDEIPLESRIIAVADVYDSLTSDRPYRKAMSPFDARDVIVRGAETEFDPRVVAAFQHAFRHGELEIWSAPLTAA